MSAAAATSAGAVETTAANGEANDTQTRGGEIRTRAERRKRGPRDANANNRNRSSCNGGSGNASGRADRSNGGQQANEGPAIEQGASEGKDGCTHGCSCSNSNSNHSCNCSGGGSRSTSSRAAAIERGGQQ